MILAYELQKLRGYEASTKLLEHSALVKDRHSDPPAAQGPARDLI
jgi:hypothetical protein